MRKVTPEHDDAELRRLIAEGLERSNEVTLDTHLFNGMQLARLAKEFGCDFSFSADYERVTLRPDEVVAMLAR